MDRRAGCAYDPVLAALRFNLAGMLVRAGDLPGARREYDLACAERGTRDRTSWHFLYPDALLDAGKLDSSVSVYEQIAEKYPRSW